MWCHDPSRQRRFRTSRELTCCFVTCCLTRCLLKFIDMESLQLIYNGKVDRCEIPVDNVSLTFFDILWPILIAYYMGHWTLFIYWCDAFFTPCWKKWEDRKRHRWYFLFSSILHPRENGGILSRCWARVSIIQQPLSFPKIVSLGLGPMTLPAVAGSDVSVTRTKELASPQTLSDVSAHALAETGAPLRWCWGLQHVTSVDVRNDLTMSWMFPRYGAFSNSITCCLAHRMPQDATGQNVEPQWFKQS